MLARRCFVDESRNATGIINQDGLVMSGRRPLIKGYFAVAR
jgi:hypothetical protein